MDIFTRSKFNPILKPNPDNSWENLKVYNPGAIYDGEIYHLFYRARGKEWSSAIGHATSSDGETFSRIGNEPILKAEFNNEKMGVEDPRLTKIDKTYYMTYGAYDGNDVKLNIATSVDLISWVKHGKAFLDFNFIEKGGNRLKFIDGLIINSNKGKEGKEWSKSGGIFPEKINGKFWMLFGEHNIWLANSDDGLRWNTINNVFLSQRTNKFFDSILVEMGPPPIKTPKGWLVLYHGADEKLVYRLGFLLLDLNDPTKILYRITKPIFEPQEPYEMKGIVDILPGGYKQMEIFNPEELNAFINKLDEIGKMPRVAFVNGAVLTGNTLRIYYGASDSVICTATANINDILNLVK